MRDVNCKILLMIAGIKQADIAKDLGVSRSAVSRVIAGQRTSRRIRAYIALRLGKEIIDLWPTSSA